jgi:hypothetical protein
MFIAKSVAQLVDVNQFIHDHWFDLDDVSFDQDTAVVTIHYIRPMPERGPGRDRVGLESFLRIHHVRHWHVEDLQRVGMYDFNEVVYDPVAKTVRITTGIPLSLLAEVNELEVSVEVTDKVAEIKAGRKRL